MFNTYIKGVLLMYDNNPSIGGTLIIILSVMLFVTLLANFGISLNADYYKNYSANKYEKWISVQNID